MDAGDIATIVAATATAASAGIIAWQAVETRRSAAAAQRAAIASEHALAVANESLAISQKQSHLGQFTALEAMRARLDDLGPSVWAAVLDESPLGYVIGDSSAQDRYDPIELGAILQVPQQQEQWLYAVYQIRISNNGQAPVLLGWSSLFGSYSQGYLSDRPEKILLTPGRTLTPYIAVGARIEHWVYGAQNDRGGYNICGEGGWGTILETQKGVALSQSVKIRGTIIRPQGLGKWELKGVGTDINYNSSLEVQKIERIYYSGEGKMLPDIDPEPTGLHTP